MPPRRAGRDRPPARWGETRRTALIAALGLGLLAATVGVQELGSLRFHNRGYVALPLTQALRGP